MAITRIALGRRDEITHPAALKAALAEFVSTLLFVFAGQGSAVAYHKLTHGIPTPPCLLVVALSHAFALSVAVSVSANVSGGHVNPAVTIGVLLGGNLTLIRAILYCGAQLLGSVAGCLLLMLCTGNSLGVFAVSGVTSGSALLFEMVMTFGLVYTVYATAVDPKKGEVGIIAPVTIGLVVGANILAGGLYTGACMNPALAFGPALVSWKWADHWIYWAGPLLGGGGAALLYNMLLISPQHGHLQVNVTADH